MASVCSTTQYIISPTTTDGKYWYWDKVNEVVDTATFSSIPDFYELSVGSIIAVSEKANQVYVITKVASHVFPINEIILTSSSGDQYNKLLYSVVVGGTLTVVMWAINAKETTTYTFQMQTETDGSPPVPITPCFKNFSISDNVIINSWCDGFTLNEIVTSGGNANLIQTPNSITCGYSAPIVPFRFSEEKEIEYRSCVLRNPVYVTWKNLVGGWEYFMFEKTQIESLDTESLGTFNVDYSNISGITNPKTEIGKTGRGRMLMGTNGLNDDQKNGLKGLLLSNQVYILNQDGTVNRQIIVTPGTFLIKVNDTIEFEITEPEINTIRN